MPLSPSSINGYDFNSAAEKQLYEAAQRSNYFNCNNRFLFHSLNMVNTGNKKQKGEIDFVYMDSECLLFLEVKGGQIKFDSLRNQWYVMGGTEPGDPFEQAYKALFHTRDALLPNHFKSRSVSSRLVFGIGVLFPDSLKPDEFRKKISGQMELDPELIYDYTDHKKERLIAFIEKLKTYWSAHPQYTGRPGISQKEMSTISRFFRQDLHFQLPVSDLLKRDGQEVARLTGMQMSVLDNLHYNPGKGGIIMGGPGTGKTLLALELLKRQISNGKHVLLICFNRNLSEFLQRESKDFAGAGSFRICHLHGIYRDESLQKNSLGSVREDSEYWNRIMPLAFTHNLDNHTKGKYDYLIIDEGQDILNEYHMEAMGALLQGGLESGNWGIFMDKDYQNIYNDDAEEYFQYMRDVYPCFVTLLQLNCRNTTSTISRAAVQTGFPPMPCLRKDDTWKSEIRTFATAIDLRNKINDLVTHMEEAGIERRCITILCFDKEQLGGLVNSNPGKYVQGAFEVPGRINVTTIHSFKGLENKFILIYGPDNYDPSNKKQMSLIYIANTRATAQSIFFINSTYHSIIEDRILNLNSN